MDIKVMRNLVPELVHVDQSVSRLAKEMYLLNNAVVSGNTEMVEVYYKTFAAAHAEYQKTSANFLRQVKRLAIDGDMSSVDREMGR
jgi:hypothetical protein